MQTKQNSTRAERYELWVMPRLTPRSLLPGTEKLLCAKFGGPTTISTCATVVPCYCHYRICKNWIVFSLWFYKWFLIILFYLQVKKSRDADKSAANSMATTVTNGSSSAATAAAASAGNVDRKNHSNNNSNNNCNRNGNSKDKSNKEMQTNGGKANWKVNRVTQSTRVIRSTRVYVYVNVCNDVQ